MAHPAEKEPHTPVSDRPEEKIDPATNMMFAPFFVLQREINHMFADTIKNFELPNNWHGIGKSLPSVDIKENDEAFSVQTHLPSKRPEDVEVSIADDFLTIKAHHKTNEKKETEFGPWSPYTAGNHLRTVMLPETANIDKAVAEMSDNILTIKVPKKQEAVDKTRKLTIKKIK